MVDTTLLIPKDEKDGESKLSPRTAAILALVFSIIAIILGITGFFRKTTVSDAILFSVDISKTVGDISTGRVVSINEEGLIQRGAGTTINKSIRSWNKKSMPHLQSVSLGTHLVVAAYDGMIMVTYIDDEGNSVYASEESLPIVDTKPRRPDDILSLKNNIVVIIGSNRVLAIKVDYSSSKATLTFGDDVAFSESISYQAVFDTLGEKCFAISYFSANSTGGNRLFTRTGCVDGNGSKPTIQLNTALDYSDNYIFHGISGLSESRYILAKAGTIDGSNNYLRFQLACVDENGLVTVKSELVYTVHKNFGFFDMDNLNDHQTIVTFIDGDLNNGVESVLLVYNKAKDRIIIGPFLDNQDGGASGMSDSGIYNFIHVRIMSESRFAVFYSNIINDGATAVVLGEVTPANDLLGVGPEYILSQPMADTNTEYYWLGECAVYRNRLVLIESLSSEDVSHTHSEIHRIDILPLSLGVVVASSAKEATIAVSGTIVVKNNLKVGKNYYGSNKGELIEGEYVGAMNMESYYVYVESADGKIILSDDNRIGYAIEEHKLLLKVHN